MANKRVLRPCGWCGVPQTARGDREHVKVCPKRPKQIVKAVQRLRAFNDRERGK